MTKALTQLDKNELQKLEQTLRADFDLVAANKLALDLSRGKPSAEQVALSNAMEDVIDNNYIATDGTDTRNYGGIRGLAEARSLGAELLGVPAENVIAGGNSSLFLMQLCTATALRRGLWGDTRKWSNSKQPKILTPVPGYDRHFALTGALGIEMVNVPITEQGPDMQQVLQLAQQDADIKGIWCVPKYSNPTGCTYSDDTVTAMAELPHKAAAGDFVVLWDNAYAVHELTQQGTQLASIFDAAQAAGTADHIVQFASTSKITFAGAGVAFVASGETVLRALEHELSFMMIGPDKVNQLRHARFLQGRLQQHMQAHAEILRPKFRAVQDILREELEGLEIAQWTDPIGGYFVSLDLLPGLASQVVEMAQSVGLKLTPAGATYPYGADPNDCNVRIAPTFASLEELRAAMQILTLCVKLASVRKLLSQNPDR
jgi:DNA-binding transcriptional MocR family regulator